MFDFLLYAAAVGLLLYTFYKWATANHQYFAQRNVKYLKSEFLFGKHKNVAMNKYNVFEFGANFYNNFPTERIYGYFDFRAPVFVVRDPEMVKRIAVTDFDNFEDRRGFGGEVNRFLGIGLVYVNGEKWRQMRATLSPAFTGSKMRQMFELISGCGSRTLRHFSVKAKNGERLDVELKDLFDRYANDVITSCAFGIEVNSFDDPQNEIFVRGQNLTQMNTFSMLAYTMLSSFPKLPQMLNITPVNTENCELFESLFLNTMDFRKKHNISRPEIIGILMKMREGNLNHESDQTAGDENDGFATVEESNIGKMFVQRKWSDDEIAAQCLTFHLAGSDSTSTLLAFIFYELVVNPDIQQKLYVEIAEIKNQIGEKPITYDALQKMKYLDQVVSKGLRKWIPGVKLDRICTRDYFYDDGELKFKVEKGALFNFPTYGLHHDPQYFPNPEKFDPERFSDENKGKIVPGTYLPFGIGPRSCIGSRFALMSMKTAIYYMLLNFSFEANEKTEIPVKVKSLQIGYAPRNGMHLTLKPRAEIE